MSTEARLDAALCALLAAVSFPILFYGLGAYSPIHMDELLYQGVARNMLASGDWLRLSFGDESRTYDALMNAPIHYWARALLIAVLGDGRWSMRLLSALFGLATACLTALVVTRLASRRAGLVAGLLLLTTFQFVHLHGARTGEMETIVAFLFVACAALFLSAVAGRRGFWGHHLCLVALAHLKLPLIALPVAAELFYFARTPAARVRLGAWLRTGAWLLPLLLVWRVLQVWLHPAESLEVLVTMWAQASGEAPKVSREHVGALGNAVFYLRTFAFGGTPAVLLAPLAIFALLRGEPRDAAAAPWRLFAANLVAVILFFLLVSKHFPWYVMPAYAFLCAFVAVWLERLPGQALGAGMATALGLALGAALWLRMPGLGYDPFTAVVRDVPEIRWGRVAGVPAALGLPLAALLGFAGLRRVPPRALASGLCAALLLVGGVRVLAPLRFLETQSEIEKLRTRVDRARAAGEALPNPILYTREPNESGLTRVWYFFGDDYWVVPQRAQGKRTRVVALYDRRLAPPPGLGESN